MRKAYKEYKYSTVEAAEMEADPYGDGPDDGNPTGDEPDGGKPSGDEPDGGKPSGDEPDGGKPSGDEPDGGKPSGDEPDGGKPSGDEPDGGKPSGDEPDGGKSSGDEPDGSKPSGDYPGGEFKEDNYNAPLTEPASNDGVLNVGAGTKPKNGAYNIDLDNPNPEIGVYSGDGTVMEGIPDGSQRIIYFENPYGFDPINENSLRVLSADGRIEVIGAPANSYVTKVPKFCEQFGLKCIEVDPIENIGQYCDSHGNVLRPERTPFFKHFIVTR